MDRDRNERGRYNDRIDPDTVMDVITARDDAARPVTATDVVEELGIARRTAHNKLNALVERGTLDTRKIGARGRVWWVPDRGDADTFDADDLRGDAATTLADESGDTDARAGAGDDATDGPADPPADAHGADADPEEDALAERVRQYLADADTPPKTEHGRAAIVDVFQYLREHGTAKTADIQDAVYPEYADKWSSARTMWNALDRYLDHVPGVEKGGYGEWTYTDDDAVRAEVNK